MVNLSDIQTNTASISNIILVNPQTDQGITAQVPKGKSDSLGVQLLNTLLPSVGSLLSSPKPSPHFLFHYTGEDTVSLTSDITDHFTEDNTALQDQISLKPIVITTHGFIGELNNVPPTALAPLKFVSDKLSTLAPYVPGVSKTAAVGYNYAAQGFATVQTAARSVVSALSLLGVGTNPVQTAQQKAFVQFYNYWNSRTLFTVQTPWAIFKDMAILSLRAVQEEDTRMVSNFEITFKKMRFAQTILANSPQSAQSRLAAQASSQVDAGVNTPVKDIGLAAGIQKTGFTI